MSSKWTSHPFKKGSCDHHGLLTWDYVNNVITREGPFHQVIPRSSVNVWIILLKKRKIFLKWSYLGGGYWFIFFKKNWIAWLVCENEYMMLQIKAHGGTNALNFTCESCVCARDERLFFFHNQTTVLSQGRRRRRNEHISFLFEKHRLCFSFVPVFRCLE